MMSQTNNKNWNEEQIAKTQIVVMAGGRAKRMGIEMPKCLLDVSNKKLIDLCIEAIAAEGFRDFVFLLGHKHEMVTEYLGYGSKYRNIQAKFSIDPPSISGWGKGKAFKYALDTGKIDRTRRSMIVFPDDIILEEKVYSKLVLTHASTARKYATLASMLLVPGTDYPYGVAEVDNISGIITNFTEKPFLKILTSAGVYLFEPDVYEIIESKIRLENESPVDLESTIMPELVKIGKLSSMIISSDKWMPINTMKEYEKVLKVLS